MSVREEWIATDPTAHRDWPDYWLDEGMPAHEYPFRHDINYGFTAMCMLVEQDADKVPMWFDVTCHYCRMAGAAQLANTGHTMTRISFDSAKILGFEIGTLLPSSLLLQRACEIYDDVALLRQLPKIFERASAITK